MKATEVLFIDVFNPNSVNEFILPKRIKDEVAKGVYTHWIFYGNSGLGKSSLAKCLAKKHPNLYINVGEEGKIETLRGPISRFCEEMTLDVNEYESDIKVVILDEIGQKSSTQFYEGLKGLMDTYKNVRFIATTNYFQLVPDSLKSRFQCVNFGFVSSEERDSRMLGFKKRTKAVIAALKMEIDETVLDTFVDIKFPDYRKGLQTIQSMYIKGIKTITNEELSKVSYEFKDLYDLILSGNIEKPEDIHELLMGQYANSAMDVLTSLNDNFVNYVTKVKNMYCKCIPDILITTAKYMDMAGRIDPSLSMKACVFTLMQYINQSNMK